MIEWLLIENFECFKKLKVDLNHAINIIIGPNDIGKSAIIRAIHWVCFNEPSGFYFLRKGATFTRVSIQVGKHLICRYKSKSKNTYSLNGKKFCAVGTKVPEKIAKILNMDSHNFQNQRDPPFWLLESSGKIGKELNKVVNLAIMDDSLQEMNRMNREFTNEIKAANTRIDDSELELKKYQHDRRIRKLADDIQRTDERHDECEKHLSGVGKLTRAVHMAKEELERSSFAAIGLIEIEKITKQYETLSYYLDTLTNCAEQLEITSKIASRTFQTFDKTLAFLECANVSEAFLERLESIVESANEEEDTICRTRDKLNNISRKLKGKNCPICGNTITSV
jgi:chromosome segregation ATPase